MKICENGVIRDMTQEELIAADDARLRDEAEAKRRPLSLGEVQDMLIRQQVNTLAVDDRTAYRMMAYYPAWASDIDYAPVGYKVTHSGKLWRLRQAHTSQDNWAPGMIGTESLWEEICEQHDGSKYDPVPYSGNMALESGKYYTQGGVLYLCSRDTGSAVYHPLSELVGNYVEVIA